MSDNFVDVEEYKKFYESKNVNGHPLNYHTIKLPNGVILRGTFDMSKYIHYYKIPDDLSGKTILDIGTGNGYFAFEFSKRGANVLTIDSTDSLWDEKLNELMGTNVKFQKQDITTIDETLGKFDIVFCSHVLQHNPDMFSNIERIRKITKERAIIASQLIKKPDNFSYAYFDGKIQELSSNERHFNTYWRPNMKCLLEMSKSAGFRKVEEISSFIIWKENKIDHSFCGVIHCFV